MIVGFEISVQLFDGTEFAKKPVNCQVHGKCRCCFNVCSNQIKRFQKRCFPLKILFQSHFFKGQALTETLKTQWVIVFIARYTKLQAYVR